MTWEEKGVGTGWGAFTQVTDRWSVPWVSRQDVELWGSETPVKGDTWETQAWGDRRSRGMGELVEGEGLSAVISLRLLSYWPSRKPPF